MKQYSIKDIQNYDLKILLDFIKVCEKYSLTYWLSSGTLLGAVRHKGFIPWDDDVDVEMPIEDYLKFCKVAQKEFGDKYFLQTYKTEKLYDMQFAKIRANNTTSIPIKRKNWKIHWGLCIDIFPIVGLYDNKILRKIQWTLFKINSAMLCVDRDHVSKEKLNIKDKLLYLIPRRVRHSICNVNNIIIYKKFWKSNSGSMLWGAISPWWNKETCNESVELDFEGYKMKAPCGYEYILTQFYGDYMQLPPLEERSGHELLLGDIIFDLENDYSYYL